MQESKELSEFMLRFKKKVNVIWGYTHDSSLGKAVKITILATGFEVSDLTFKGNMVVMPTSISLNRNILF